jgi:cell wall-associated NlpC family hydrolase
MSDHQLDVMSQLDQATVAKSNADAKAKALVQLQTSLTQQAQAAFNSALAARQAQQSQQAQLQSQQASYQKQLDAAKSSLATLQGQRKQYLAYQAEQARIAAEKARQAELARQRAAAAAAAAIAAQQAANNNDGASGQSSGGGQVVNVSNPAAGSGGSWTLAKGEAAVARAMTTIGTPYAWAGGGYNGPTFGVNSPGTDGWNDSQVFGYDCSGLTMFAWASQGLYMAHYAATQYSQAGSFHPSPGNYEPGDLLFWGLPGQSSIHHVAMYIGNGIVIQAPNSGSVVQVTPWDQVSGDYYGATRPLT